MAIGPLPPDTRGIDCNFAIDTALAKNIYAAGFRFVQRYVGRTQQRPQDASSAELQRLLNAGIAVGLVQHVKSADSWDPEGAELGALYGRNAALLARQCGYASGASLWCDLEGVAVDTPSHTVIAYVNAWTDSARSGGYDPGVYVGWHAGLSAHELYWRLKARRFWASYNLNKDQYPAVRGVQMQQKAATAKDRIVGIDWLSAIDVNIVQRDALGGLPTFMLAPGDR